jgi:hypothetical protein
VEGRPQVITSINCFGRARVTTLVAVYAMTELAVCLFVEYAATE